MEEKQQTALHCIFCGSTKFKYYEKNMPKEEI